MHTITASTQPPAKARGFTLIELMITIAVAIILAGIAMPSFRSMIASERISSESFDVVAMLTLTRSEAIKRNTAVTSTPNNGNWKQGWVIATTYNSNPVTINSKDALSGSDITITCYQGGTALAACSTITYQANGRLKTGSVAESIQILSSSLPSSGGQNARCISITLSGMPISKKGSC